MGKGERSAKDKIAQSQVDIQAFLAGLSKDNAAYGRQTLQPATDYWQKLLQGGQEAKIATGPYADLIGQSASSTRRGIEESLPMGGQREKALVSSRLDEQGQVARLYSGIQPMAAERLTTAAGIPYGVSVGFSGSAAPQIGAALNSYSQNESNNMNTATQFGRLAYNTATKASGGGGRTPSWNPNSGGDKSGGGKG